METRQVPKAGVWAAIGDAGLRRGRHGRYITWTWTGREPLVLTPGSNIVVRESGRTGADELPYALSARINPPEEGRGDLAAALETLAASARTLGKEIPEGLMEQLRDVLEDGGGEGAAGGKESQQRAERTPEPAGPRSATPPRRGERQGSTRVNGTRRDGAEPNRSDGGGGTRAEEPQEAAPEPRRGRYRRPEPETPGGYPPPGGVGESPAGPGPQTRYEDPVTSRIIDDDDEDIPF